MVRLQLYNLVSCAAVLGYWPGKGAAVVPPVKSYEARPGQCPVSIMVMAAAARIIKVL